LVVIPRLTEAMRVLVERLEHIEQYGKDHDGCCPYGCDMPWIAANALARAHAILEGS
jgi:hypothetical protein